LVKICLYSWYEETHLSLQRKASMLEAAASSTLFPSENWVSFYLLIYLIFKIFILFICAYIVWVISPPFPLLHPLPPRVPSLTPSYPLLPGRNYSALISNFVEERV
jgi:hypothetical protein